MCAVAKGNIRGVRVFLLPPFPAYRLTTDHTTGRPPKKHTEAQLPLLNHKMHTHQERSQIAFSSAVIFHCNQRNILPHSPASPTPSSFEPESMPSVLFPFEASLTHPPPCTHLQPHTDREGTFMMPARIKGPPQLDLLVLLVLLFPAFASGTLF